ncbi:MAG: hypothetical protein U1E43_07350 [Rhodospirillales bacterium]
MAEAAAPAATDAATAAAKAAITGLPAVNTAAAQALLSPDQTLQTVDFPETGTTTVAGRIEGNKSVAYAVPARAGQKLTVTMTTSSTSAYFNIKDVRDQSGAAVHRGDVDGPNATISVPADTTYLIDPYLVRAAASRDSTADYTLTISRK